MHTRDSVRARRFSFRSLGIYCKNIALRERKQSSRQQVMKFLTYSLLFAVCVSAEGFALRRDAGGERFFDKHGNAMFVFHACLWRDKKTAKNFILILRGTPRAFARCFQKLLAPEWNSNRWMFSLHRPEKWGLVLKWSLFMLNTICSVARITNVRSQGVNKANEFDSC